MLAFTCRCTAFENAVQTVSRFYLKPKITAAFDFYTHFHTYQIMMRIKKAEPTRALGSSTAQPQMEIGSEKYLEKIAESLTIAFVLALGVKAAMYLWHLYNG